MEPPYKIDGLSYYPTLTEKPQKAHDYLYWEFAGYKGQQAIRIGSWKGYKKNLNIDNVDLQLYDLSKDPKELNDLAAEYPKIVKKMKNFMDQAHTTPAIKRFIIPVLEK